MSEQLASLHKKGGGDKPPLKIRLYVTNNSNTDRSAIYINNTPKEFGYTKMKVTNSSNTSTRAFRLSTGGTVTNIVGGTEYDISNYTTGEFYIWVVENSASSVAFMDVEFYN